MARYRKIEVQIWGDKKYRCLSSLPPCGQGLWLYLLTSTNTGPIPGLFRAGRAAMAEELGWELKDFDKAFEEVSQQGMVKADFEARVIWIPNAIKHNKPESPNVVISWGKEIDLIPECELKDEAIARLYEYVQLIDSESDNAQKQSYSKAFEKAFAKSFAKALIKPFVKTMSNQEQEQEQEQDIKPPINPPRGRCVKNKFDPLLVELPDWLLPDLWSEWVEYRKALRKPIKTLQGAVGSIRELEKYREDGISPEAVIRHSIAREYQGLYPPRERENVGRGINSISQPDSSIPEGFRG